MKRLYIESNFVLQLVFSQEQGHLCERLLAAADQRLVELVLPAFCLAEPFETLTRRHKDRRKAQHDVQYQMQQLERSHEYKALMQDVQPVMSIFERSALEDRSRIEYFYSRFGSLTRLLPLTSETTDLAFSFRPRLDLAMQDAVIFANVLTDLDQRPCESAFVTRNSKDFDDPDVRAELTKRDCKLFTNFGPAVKYATS